MSEEVVAPASHRSPLESRHDGESSAAAINRKKKEARASSRGLSKWLTARASTQGDDWEQVKNETKPSTRAGFLRTLAEIMNVPRPSADADGRLPWRVEYESLEYSEEEEQREAEKPPRPRRFPLGLRWRAADTAGRKGDKVVSAELSKALAQKVANGEPLEFEVDEFDQFQLPPLTASSFVIANQAEYTPVGAGSHAKLLEFLRTPEGNEYLQTCGMDLDSTLGYTHPSVQRLVEIGWNTEHATAFMMLYQKRATLSSDLTPAPAFGVRFPACNFALAEALFHTAACVPSATRGHARLYKHLHGSNSLQEDDPAWGGLLTPDRVGFRGLTSTAICTPTDDPRCFVAEGFMNPEEGAYEYKAGDVVCFESSPNEEFLMHQIVMINEHAGALPAITLFRLKRVDAPGKWAVDGVMLPESKAGGGGTGRKLPKKMTTKKHLSAQNEVTAKYEDAESLERATVYPNCKRFVVSCTFRQPSEVVTAGAQCGKLCGTVQTLMFANREAYVKGLDDVIAQPKLSLKQEFSRDAGWFDWQGTRHTLKQVWAYVNGPAVAALNGPGVRDENNVGMKPEQFMKRANAFIEDARRAFIEGNTDLSGGDDPALLLLDEADAYLTIDETLAVRLYSGPAYQPINDFLREIGKLSKTDYRVEIARNERLTFAATTRHLCDAIRKLADVTREEAAGKTLYRAVRGELPPAFWDRDQQGLISATDVAFMSTSRNQRTPLNYMAGELNVLWELEASAPSDDAYHRGADISMLSQYAHEDEVLFPPCTMMIVVPPRMALGSPAGSTPNPKLTTTIQGSRQESVASLSVNEHDGLGLRWERIGDDERDVRIEVDMCNKLSAALGVGKLVFERDEFESFGVEGIRPNCYIEGADGYDYAPVGELIDAGRARQWKRIRVRPCFV